MGRLCAAGAILLGGCYGGFDGAAAPAQSTGSVPVDPPAATSSGVAGDESTSGGSSTTEDPSADSTDATGDERSSESGREAETSSSSGGEPAIGCDAVADALLCDDFEQGEIDPTRWIVEEENGGSIAVEPGVVRSGSLALHIHLESAEAGHAMLRTQPGSIFPVDGNRIFGRAYVHIESAVPLTHSYLLSTEGPLDGTTARYRLDSNGGRLNSRYTHASVEEHGGWRKMGRDAQTDAWICVEWEHDGATDQMRYWFDGELDADMEVLSTEDPPWIAPVFERFELGFHTFQQPSEASYDIWYDDVVLAAQRIGC